MKDVENCLTSNGRTESTIDEAIIYDSRKRQEKKQMKVDATVDDTTFAIDMALREKDDRRVSATYLHEVAAELGQKYKDVESKAKQMDVTITTDNPGLEVLKNKNQWNCYSSDFESAEEATNETAEEIDNSDETQKEEISGKKAKLNHEQIMCLLNIVRNPKKYGVIQSDIAYNFLHAYFHRAVAYHAIKQAGVDKMILKYPQSLDFEDAYSEVAMDLIAVIKTEYTVLKKIRFFTFAKNYCKYSLGVKARGPVFGNDKKGAPRRTLFIATAIDRLESTGEPYSDEDIAKEAGGDVTVNMVRTFFREGADKIFQDVPLSTYTDSIDGTKNIDIELDKNLVTNDDVVDKVFLDEAVNVALRLIKCLEPKLRDIILRTTFREQPEKMVDVAKEKGLDYRAAVDAKIEALGKVSLIMRALGYSGTDVCGCYA